jgi:uncharacterized caspase-like protein
VLAQMEADKRVNLVFLDPFTAALLKHIGEPGVDIGATMRKVRADVIAATHERQVPWDHSSLVGDVVLAR